MPPTTDATETAEACRLAIEASPSGVVLVDEPGTIVLVNGALERLSGCVREELIGKRLELLLPGIRAAGDAVWRAAGGAAGEGAADIAGELVLRRKDGSEIGVEMELRPVRTPDGLFVLAAIADITERRRLHDAQRAALEEQIAFEQFVAELSFQFVNLPGDQVAEAVQNGLGRICEQLGLDRGSFYRIDSEGTLSDANSWTAPGIPPVQTPAAARTLFPWALERVAAGEVLIFSTLDEVPSEIDRASFSAFGTKSALIMPVSVGGRVVGVVGFSTVRTERAWQPSVVHRLEVIRSVLGQVLARQQREDALRSASREAQRLKDQLQAENFHLRREELKRLHLTRIVGQSAAIRQVLGQIQQVATTDSTVLLLGETGTGKELLATEIHELSGRHARAMVRVNCASIPATLIDSELFGREKGAFTGALARQIGRFELADHSTIFLDEIGDLPLDVQIKLLRVLEERRIERLGSPRLIAVDTRIIAATHRDLEQRVSEGTFREDLYYRLNVFPIHVPPLRERLEDIPLLVWGFVEECSKAFGKRIDSIDRDSLVALQQHSWPGNIRELRNVVERAVILATSRRLSILAPQKPVAPPRRSPKLADVEKDHIRAVLESTGWRIRGAGGAADRLGLKPTTLETRMAKLGLRRPGHG